MGYITPNKHNTKFYIAGESYTGLCLTILSPQISISVNPAFAKLLADMIISVSCSPWCYPLHFMHKKDDSWHPMGDYRPLNNLTIPDTYPLPHLQSFVDQLHGKTVFSKIDLKDAFLQILLHPDHVPKTMVTTPFGAFQYHYMPFGLSGASQSFQQFIGTALHNIIVTLPNGKQRDFTVVPISTTYFSQTAIMKCTCSSCMRYFSASLTSAFA